MLLYHGSDVVVKCPDLIKTSKFTKDFGDGFYCTTLEQQAARWAIRKGKGTGYVSAFVLDEIKFNSLNVLQFTTTNLDWLNFVAYCRMGKKHNYDAVVGPIADDTVYNYVQNYIDGLISATDFMLLAKFNFATHQVVFCTEASKSCIRYVNHRKVV